LQLQILTDYAVHAVTSAEKRYLAALVPAIPADDRGDVLIARGEIHQFGVPFNLDT
jgi:hypothetical protein